ncbi:hypothetical protein BT96DRAFT_977160 [Gymnopus androsaceus JB14]|uniref:Uncharacterized protein n=1 Tax=Gymnopus androsaceus JB14 TaxID=1447944 RepID=A0A6A4HGR0_9AGAR|nr:hypothetical protein BT96DRAFT_977160 [Gymnopus androsaceus JB14]
MASSSSIFSRPVSPPPRAVTPDVHAFVALNPPPVRSKKLPGKSGLETSPNPLMLRKPSKGILKPTPPPSPSPSSSASFHPSSPSSSSRGFSHTHTPTLTHRRSIQFAIPYRSPPASPTLAASPPPPVPPIPAFALDTSAHTSRPAAQYLTLTPPRPTRNPRREVGTGASFLQYVLATYTQS